MCPARVPQECGRDHPALDPHPCPGVAAEGFSDADSLSGAWNNRRGYRAVWQIVELAANYLDAFGDFAEPDPYSRIHIAFLKDRDLQISIGGIARAPSCIHPGPCTTAYEPSGSEYLGQGGVDHASFWNGSGVETTPWS